MKEVLIKYGADAESFEENNISASVGKEMKQDAIVAIILAAGGEIKAILLLLAILVAAVFGVSMIAARERRQEQPDAAPENRENTQSTEMKTDEAPSEHHENT